MGFLSTALAFAVVANAQQIHSNQPASLAESSRQPVRVRFLRAATSVSVSGFGLRLAGLQTSAAAPASAQASFLSRPLEKRGLGSALPQFRKIKIDRVTAGWRVRGGDGIALDETVPGEELRLLGDMIKVDGRAMADHLAFVSQGRRFDVIVNVPMLDYLKGVLPSEMPAQWPREALKAQAVAARSYVLSVMQERTREPYDVDDTVLHQVFSPRNFTAATASEREKLSRALHATMGVQMIDTRGGPFRSYYHADCGGRTEAAAQVWGGSEIKFASAAGLLNDERCALNPRSEWSIVLTKAELLKTFRSILKLDDHAEITGVETRSRTESGRAQELAVHFVSGEAKMGYRNLSAQDFRRLVGYNRLRSTFFDMKFTSRGLEVRGRGHGHGVGLCQKGARFMALAGASYLDILKRYYPEAKLLSAPVKSLRAGL